MIQRTGESGPVVSITEEVLFEQTFFLPNVAIPLLNLVAPDKSVFDVRAYFYSEGVANDPTYKVFRAVLVVGTAIGAGSFPLDASEPTFGALTWNISSQNNSGACLISAVTTAGSGRNTNLRIVLVRPLITGPVGP